MTDTTAAEAYARLCEMAMERAAILLEFLYVMDEEDRRRVFDLLRQGEVNTQSNAHTPPATPAKDQ